jgi:phage-related protein
MEEKPKFKIIYSEEVIAFLNGLGDKAKAKIMYNINRSKYVIDKTFFKKLEGSDIWEFRTLYNGIQYRIFAFWDTEEDTLVITTHGITKKTQKTPSKEIAKAEKIRKEYFNLKK